MRLATAANPKFYYTKNSRYIFKIILTQISPKNIFQGRSYWPEIFRSIITYWSEQFWSIIPYWPELFWSIIPYWPELFWSIIPYWPELFWSIRRRGDQKSLSRKFPWYWKSIEVIFRPSLKSLLGVLKSVKLVVINITGWVVCWIMVETRQS